MNVPAKHLTADGLALGKWLDTQRTAYMNHTLAADGRVWYPHKNALRGAEDEANRMLFDCRPEEAHVRRKQHLHDAMDVAAKTSFDLDDGG